MRKFIFELIITIIFVATMIINIIEGTAWLAALDGIVVGTGVCSCILSFEAYQNNKNNK